MCSDAVCGVTSSLLADWQAEIWRYCESGLSRKINGYPPMQLGLSACGWAAFLCKGAQPRQGECRAQQAAPDGARFVEPVWSERYVVFSIVRLPLGPYFSRQALSKERRVACRWSRRISNNKLAKRLSIQWPPMKNSTPAFLQ